MNKVKRLILIGGSFFIVIFLIYIFFGGSPDFDEHWTDRFTDFNRILTWFLGYIFCFIVGLAFRFYVEGGELEKKEAKEIRAWKTSKSKDNTIYDDKITLADKLIYKWGHPLDISVWDFEKGFVNWLVQTPLMGAGTLIVGGLAITLAILVVLIPIAIFKYLYSFF